ncbi:ribosomal protein S18 acetylase RimI-like enzyme [Actinoplanes campanulatus]|uniref:Ribosomal protein S18 acetylase RimI-like enzyme n=1 Tax=Actinoplanes campanulatus TaxID=113559 RepID=A0A7W5ASD9_9ACTN|nr:GNAT family N-acetyltransferase [Actinoplanes campanulatus]MBB3101552.1 ribosomal protein S18 acetylase RimI-like enzyme [Actinoplanes campanulatus]
MTTSADLALAEPSDLDAIVKIFGHRQYFAEQLADPKPPGDTVFLARRGEDFLGTVTVGPVGADEAQLRAGFPPDSARLLTHLEVPEKFRNHGIGTWIMREVEQRVAQGGFRQIVLGVDLDNAGAARLYQRLGYQLWRHDRVPTVKVHYREDGTSWSEPDWCLIFFKDLWIPASEPAGQSTDEDCSSS